MRSTEKTKKRGLPELLSPAGSPEALAAAIESGADAVYLGLSAFSNRMRARNFSSEELSEAATLCSVYGVKLYLTLNVRVFDREREQLERICDLDGVNRADGIIVADLGLAAMLKERVPHVPLHASTQITGVTAGDAATLERLGFSRMVCPRELTSGQIAALVKGSPIDIEMFVHGAHCVSFSGQCLMSFAMGGRSPNRGECAQPCRMEYTVERGGRSVGGFPLHPLSLRDMALARHIPEIIDMNVASLKIEGRQKGADYVGGVTAIYRKLLDERRAATDGEMMALEELFSRDGFTDGYFTGARSRMTGVRRDGEGDRSSPRKTGIAPDRKVRIKAAVTVKAGEPSTLTLTDGVKTVKVSSSVPEPAVSAPLDSETVVSCLIKTGSTPFSLDRGDIEVTLDPGLWLTRANLNELRRLGTDALLAAHSKREGTAPRPSPRKTPAVERPAGDELRIGEFFAREQVTARALGYFDRIFLPEAELLAALSRVAADRVGIALPPVSFSDEALDASLAAAKRAGARYALVNTFSQLQRARALGFETTASIRFNVTSSDAAAEIYALGADRVTASVELSAAALSRLTVPVGAAVYGRFPLMYTARCIFTDRCGKKGCCEAKKEGGAFLKDRKGSRMPVIPSPGCGSLIFNANPVWEADKGAELEKARLTHRTYLFTTERPDEVDRVIAAYENGEPPADPSRIRRI